MIARLKIIRDIFTPSSSAGLLFINDVFFCYTLEDTARAENVKIGSHTAIPSGDYKVMLTQSKRFGRLMPLIYNQTDLSIDNKGVKFTGVRLHGGNTVKDTDGCILVAFNRVNPEHIYKQAETELTEKLKNYSEINLQIINKPTK